jgi:hypothetical protein
MRCFTIAIALALLGVDAASAHHSFAAMYDAQKPVRLVGTLTRVEWTNPHSHFFLDVKGRDGKITAWVCEGAAPGILSRRGFSKTDIKIGDALIVDGYLARSGAKVIDARRVELPNGNVVFGGSDDGGPAGRN